MVVAPPGGVASLNDQYKSTTASLTASGQASVAYGSASVRSSASFAITGGPVGLTYSLGIGMFSESLTFTHPAHPNGSVGFVTLKYRLDGTIAKSGDGTAFAQVVVVGGDTPFFPRGQSHTTSTSGEFNVPGTFQIVYGQPLFVFFCLGAVTGKELIPRGDFSTGLLTTAPCSAVATPFSTDLGEGSATADFTHTLILSGVTVTDEAGNPVEDVEISSGSGQPYTTNGVLKPFADTFAKLDVHGGSGILQLKELFTLSADSDGINPETESIALQVGSFSIRFPAGSFQRDKAGRFKLAAIIEGVAVEAQLLTLGDNKFELKIDAANVNSIDLTNPTIRLSIGDDEGVTAPIIDFK
jgi:hypothetical protein